MRRSRRGDGAPAPAEDVEITSRPRSRRDAGFSAVEIVVTIALLGVVVLPILEAVRVGVMASSRSHNAARTETALVNAADRVARAPMKCDYTTSVQAAVQVQGWAATLGSATHERFVSGGSPASPGTWVPGGCEFAGPTDGLVQRVTITVTSPDGKITRDMQVVKSDLRGGGA